MDVHEDFESNTITATFELPGMKKDQVTIEVQDGLLVVSGQTTEETEENKKGYTVRERRCGKFSRSVTLPKGTKVRAQYLVGEYGRY
jgi:HSP20 family protein